MEPRTLTKQTIRKDYSSLQEVALKYYTILFTLNSLHLTPRELQLLAFTATRGSISSGGAKQQFIEQYKTSRATIGNLITSLLEKGLLVEEGKQKRVHPAIRVNFSYPLLLSISLIKTNSNGSIEGN